MWNDLAVWIGAGCASTATLAALGAFVMARNARIAAVETRSVAATTISTPSKCIGCRELMERTDAIEATIMKMDARDRMRRVRANRDYSDEPDPVRDPASWKTYMRRKKALGGANDAP